MNYRLSKLAALFILLLAAGCGIAAGSDYSISSASVPFSQFQDLIARHSAFTIFSGGGNPYDEPALNRVQHQTLGPGEWGFIPYLNPPWTLIVFSPVLAWPYPIASLLLLIANAAIIFALPPLISRSGRTLSLKHLLLMYLFPANLFCLLWGQLGASLGFFFTLFYLAFNSGRYLAAGVTLALMTAKPQLFYLLPIWLMFWNSGKARRDLVFGFILGLGLLLGLTEFISPGITASWIQASRTHRDDLLFMRSTNLPGLLACYLGGNFGPLPTWPLYLFPLLSILSAAAVGLLSKVKLPPLEVLPTFLCLSLFLTPYSWHHDLALLYPVHILIVERLLSVADPKRRWGIAVLLLIQVLVLLQTAFFGRGVAEFAWLPAAMALIWLRLLAWDRAG